METNMFTMLTAFLVPILLLVGFMFMYRGLASLNKESMTETNSILREILAELKKRSAN